jgi:hypothetical protein
MVFDEHGICGSSKYYGDNDAHLDRINVFYLGRQVGKYVPRAVLFDLEASAIGAVTLNAARRTLQPGNLVNHTRGNKMPFYMF